MRYYWQHRPFSEFLVKIHLWFAKPTLHENWSHLWFGSRPSPFWCVRSLFLPVWFQNCKLVAKHLTRGKILIKQTKHSKEMTLILFSSKTNAWEILLCAGTACLIQTPTPVAVPGLCTGCQQSPQAKAPSPGETKFKPRFKASTFKLHLTEVSGFVVKPKSIVCKSYNLPSVWFMIM